MAFLLSAFVPWLVTIILLIGAVYLAFEGAEKIYEYFVPHKLSEDEAKIITLTESAILTLEKDKIKSAIVTDFILSVEIVIIALGTVLGEQIITQIIVVSIVALIATIGVYGIVALIVRMDDFGYKLMTLSDDEKSISKKIGNLLVRALPEVIKSLSVIGTIALILVAGGIFVHKIDFLDVHSYDMPFIFGEFITGLLVGAIAFVVVKTGKHFWRKLKPPVRMNGCL